MSDKLRDAEINLIRLVEQVDDPDPPPTGYRYAYMKADGEYEIDSLGNVTGPFGTGGGTDADAFHVSVSGEIAAVTGKTTPVDADVTLIEDSAASNAKKKLTWANLKATLKSYFDTLYAVAAKGVTNGDTHDHNGGDGGTIAYGSLSGTPTIPTQYTDEMAQDAVGAMVDGTLTYVDATPLLKVTDGGIGTTQLANDSVTFAKMQNVAANSVPARAAGTSGDLSEVALAASELLGRGASGNVAAIQLGTNLSMSGTTLNAGGSAVDSDAIHDNVSGEISAITEKTTLVNDDLFLIEDSEASYAKKKVKKSNVGGGGGAPTTSEYVTTASDGGLSAEVVIPGMAGSADIAGAGGAGTAEEFDGSDPITWSSNPDTFNCDSTIKSHYYVVDNDGSAKYGYVAWSPAGAFDARWRVFFGADHTDANDFSIGVWIGDNTNTDGLVIGAGPNLAAPETFIYRAYTVSGGAFTQRGVNFAIPGGSAYLRITRDGSNNIRFYLSDNGLVWRLIATQNFSLTVARRGFRINSVSANNVYLACDWMRADV